MTEQEYIDATNLAKLRTAYTILHDCLAMREEERTMQRDVRTALRKWMNHLEPIVAIDPEKPSSSASDSQPGADE